MEATEERQRPGFKLKINLVKVPARALEKVGEQICLLAIQGPVA